MTRRERIVASARAWLGTPYRHQASQRGVGTDCLGLVRGVWRDVVGEEQEMVPPYTADWAECSQDELLWSAAARHLRENPITAMKPGDVLLFRMRHGRVAKHVGILSATRPNPAFIHAYAGHAVVESALTDAWHRRLVACFTFPTGAG